MKPKFGNLNFYFRQRAFQEEQFLKDKEILLMNDQIDPQLILIINISIILHNIINL